MSKTDELNLDGFVVVGKVRDSHGLKGELFVVTNLDEPPPWVSEFTEFVLEYQSQNEKGKHETVVQKFSVKKTRPHKKGFIVKSDEIEDRNASDIFKGAVFYIPSTHLQTQTGESIYLKEIENFKVYDKDKLVGTIAKFSTNNAQDLLVVRRDDESEVEIPFVQAFVIKIDPENKKLDMDLPEGLVGGLEDEEN